MKINRNYILILFGFLIFAQSPVLAGAGDLLREKLKKVNVTGLGLPTELKVFEDTDPINFNQKVNIDMKAFVLSDIPQSAILEDRRDNYLGSIIPGALYLESGDGASYVSSHFYLDCGYKDAAGNWVQLAVGKDTTVDTNSSDPRISPKIYYSLDEETEFVAENFSVSALNSIKADGISCKDAQNLCGPDCNPPEHSDKGKKQVIKNLREKVKNLVPIEKDSLIGEGSGVYIRIYYLDRTPPWIDDCSDNKFPLLGENTAVNTGDFFHLEDLKIKENKDSEVKVKIAMGKIDECPNPNDDWTKSEKWNNGTVQTVKLSGSGRKEGYMTDVISPPPNNCYGYMRYTVFAQDQGLKSQSLNKRVGNLNPGCASIIEDDPTNCYGLPNNNPYCKDLSTSPGNAKPWPYKENNFDVSEETRNKMSIEGITGNDRIHEGYIRISDNDLPNILIKLSSAKYGEEKQIFFPPCIPAGKLTIIDSYNNNISWNNSSSNQKAYDDFVGESRNILKECNYKEVENSTQRPYFTIFDLVSSKYMNNKDVMYQSKFLNNADPAFINKHFRLEDQTHSDTDSYGKPDETLESKGISLLGKRNGTWEKVVALVENLEDSEVQIQEDVEYQLGVWVDDSVKWANSHQKEKNVNDCESTNIPIPSGIYDGRIIIDIPNQSPPFHKVYDFPKSGTVPVVTKSVQDPIRVVFREPTIDVKIGTIEDLERNKFPSITVEATDFAGNTRTMQLYFRVKDENAKIKTLQKRHQQY